MFGRKHKPQEDTITLFDTENQLIGRWPLREYVLPEEAVLALSLEYFNDPEPCQIHRGAVQWRAVMELASQYSGLGQVQIDDMTAAQRRYFPSAAAAFSIMCSSSPHSR